MNLNILDTQVAQAERQWAGVDTEQQPRKETTSRHTNVIQRTSDFMLTLTGLVDQEARKKKQNIRKIPQRLSSW